METTTSSQRLVGVPIPPVALAVPDRRRDLRLHGDVRRPEPELPSPRREQPVGRNLKELEPPVGRCRDSNGLRFTRSKRDRACCCCCSHFTNYFSSYFLSPSPGGHRLPPRRGFYRPLTGGPRPGTGRTPLLGGARRPICADELPLQGGDRREPVLGKAGSGVRRHGHLGTTGLPLPRGSRPRAVAEVPLRRGNASAGDDTGLPPSGGYRPHSGP